MSGQKLKNLGQKLKIWAEIGMSGQLTGAGAGQPCAHKRETKKNNHYYVQSDEESGDVEIDEKNDDVENDDDKSKTSNDDKRPLRKTKVTIKRLQKRRKNDDVENDKKTTSKVMKEKTSKSKKMT